MKYLTGEEIRAGDVITEGERKGRVVFVLDTNDFLDGWDPVHWAYLGDGMMIDTDQAGLVFKPWIDEDLILVARSDKIKHHEARP